MAEESNNRQTSLVENRHVNGNVAEQVDSFTAEEALDAAGVGMFQVKLVVLSGFIWMARGFEMVILTSTNSMQACTWNLKLWHGVLMNTMTHLSTILGCFLYGIWSDKYGRRTALSSSLIFLFVFGAVSAGLPNFTWFVIFRTVVGFAIGGLPQTLVLCCEYMPGTKRGRAIYFLYFFWALGIIIMLSVLYSTVDTLGSWRMFIAIGALPAFIAMLMMRFFPESFRFLMVTNQYYAAGRIFAELAESNKKSVPGCLALLPTKKKRVTSDLLRPPFVRPIILLFLMGFITAISVLGLEGITTEIVQQGQEDIKPFNGSEASSFLGDMSSAIPCVNTMTSEEFIFITWTTALDFPGFVIYLILVDVIDRKKLLCASYIFSSIFIFLLCIPAPWVIMYIVFVYGARILLNSQFDLILLVAAETFPTSHRGTAVGLVTSSFYVGLYLGSYLTKVFLPMNPLYPIIANGVLVFLCSIAAICLKDETRGREMTDVIAVS